VEVQNMIWSDKETHTYVIGRRAVSETITAAEVRTARKVVRGE
jgi:hypothetical protein